MRIVRRLVQALVIVLTLVIGAAAAAIIVSQTAWFKNRLRGYIVSEAHQYLNGTLSIGRLGGNLFFGLEMENIGISMDGSQIVAVKDLGLDYNVFELFTRGLSVDNIRLDKPVIYLRREGDTWSLSRLIKKQETEADRRGPARPIAIEDIGISDGSFVIDGPVGTSGVDVPKRFDHLDAKLSFKYEPVRYSIEITHVSFRGSEPALALNALSGGVAVKEDTVYVERLALRTAETSLSLDGAVQHYLTKPVFNLQISSDKLSVPELARIVPALAGIRLQPSFNVKTDGPLDRLKFEMNVQSSAGALSAKGVADVMTPGQAFAGDVSVRHLDLAPILNDPQQRSDITADARVDVRGAALSTIGSLHGTLSLDSPRLVAAGYVAERVHATARIDGRIVAIDGRAAAYGADATTRGRLVLPENDDDALVYDVRGRTRHLDLRRLPRQLGVPSAATNVSADYHIRGRSSSMTGDARFEPSTVAGARIAAGSTAAFTKNGTRIGYAADATVADLDLRRFGEQFKIAALADGRYTSAISGHIAASGHGTTPEEMELTGNGTLTDSSIFGGRIPRLSFDAVLAHDTVHVKATGDVADLDPAVAAERPSLQGRIGGAVDIDATLSHVSRGVTADSVQGTAKVDLQPSTIGDLDVTRAALDADYHDSSGDIRTLQIVGRDINVEASGTLALNDTGSSNLKVHADSPSLDQIGKLANQPLTGIAALDATVTGNKRELRAAGTFTGDAIKYGDNGALTVSGDYTVRMPDLAVADANVTVDTHATFVTLAGQNINELDGKTTYHQKQVEFDMTAKQPERSLGATGLVLLHPDHQEVHLQKLGLQTAGVAWQLEPGSEATVNYAQDTVAVTNLKLVSGDQHITADGSFGRPGDALHVTLDDVDLAGMDAILLREPQLSGRLRANGTVTGTREAPNANADFHVDQGGFRQFHYDTFGGTFSYAGRGLTLDAKLQQNSSTFITAKGYLPTAVFSAISAEERAAAHGTTAAPDDRVDLHVESTPIDLGLLQGLTTELTNVTGTLQAKIDVTGSAADPHPNGLVTVLHGAFTVPSTGASYTNLDGKIELQPDRVHVGAISVLDNHLSPLVVSGDLAIHERAVGGVQVYIHSDDFKVIDNKMGNVRINSDMRIAGELRAARIEGDLGVTTGTINLDPILAQIGDSAYATNPTEYTTPATDAAGQKPVPNAFEALKMNVHVTVPDDLVVKSTDLQAPGSPVGLGAMTVTLGGDVRATKEPRGQIALVGAVNTVRGFYDFRGRRFEILRDGTVRFGGEALSELDPILDIRTRRLIQGVEARVNVRGTLKEPEIALASTPPLEDADILSLIVFNQPVNQLGETQQMNLVQQAQYLAGGALTGSLARSIAESLNLNEFDINLAPESGRGPQVTLGQQLGQNLYVKVQQGIGDQSQTNFVLEYELAKWLRMQTNVMQGSSTQQQLFQRMQGSGVDLLFFFSY